MKKILLSIILIFALLLSFAACDLENDKDDDKDDEEVGEEVAEDNIDAVVDSINKGVDFDALMNSVNITVEGEQIDVDAIVEQAKQTAAQMMMTLAVADSEAEFYVGKKDSAVCIMSETPDGATQAWSFLEDDLKVVTVNGDSYGGYYGEVVADLSEYLGMMDTTAPEIDPQTEEILNIIKGMKFPEITKKDISYKNGKYYVSNDYLLDVFGVVLEKIYDYSMQMEGQYDYGYSEGDYDYDEDYEAEAGMTPDDIKSMAKEYVDGLKLKFYFYMENETVTGFGVSVKPTKAKAEELLGYENVELLVDVNKANFEIKALVSGADEVGMDCHVISKAEFDAEGKFKKYTFEADCSVPYNDYVYTEGDYYYSGDEIMLSGMQRMYAGITVNADNLASGNGEWMNVQWTYETKNITASVWDDEEYEYSYSAEYTEEYAATLPAFDFTIAYEATSFKAYADVKADGENYILDAKCDIEHTGDVIEGNMTLTANAAGEEMTVNAKMVGDMSSAPDFPEIPAEVQSAREEAVAEYDYYY